MTLCGLFNKSILAILLLFGQLVLASPEDNWLLGTQAYQQGDFAGALQHFESTRRSRQSGPAVHYNIGVCEYKLGRYTDARETFTTLGAHYPKMRPLTEYNLGLVELKLNNIAAARRDFRAAYYLSEDNEKLRILSSHMLRQTESAAVANRAWIGSFGIRAGYDDNVVLRDDLGVPAGVTTDSPMVDIFGSLQGPYRGKNRIRLDASAYVVRYLDSDDFDQSVIRLGAIYDWRGRGWNTELGLHAVYGTLGGDGFNETGSASFRVSRKLSPSTSLALRYQYDDVSAVDAVFSGIDGSKQKVDARYRWFTDELSLVLAYQIESNDRNDPSVSPQRNRIIVQYRSSPASGWGFKIGGDYRSSKFDDLVPARTENLTTLRAALTKTLPSQWQILAEYQYSKNDSTDATFSYQRNLITLGLLRVF